MRKHRLICGLLAAAITISGFTSAYASETVTTEAVTEQQTTAEEAATVEAAAEPLVDVSGLSSYPEAPEVTADAILLLEAKSGTILYQKNGSAAHYPASITKIMTALLVIENCSLDEIVTFSYRATHELESGSSSIARTEGEEMTVRDCLYAMLVASANEVAQALAEHVSGSFEAFAELMTKRAKELGCTNTNFTNPSGLHDDNHYTSCHDMALIMAEAIKNPTFVEINSTTSYTVPVTNKHTESFEIAMKHELLRGSGKYKYAVCGKTGYTSDSGFTLVTYATKDDMDLICVAMNCSSSAERSESTKSLFEYGFSNFAVYNVCDADPSLDTGGAKGFLSGNLVSLSVQEDSYVVLPTTLAFSDLTSTTRWNEAASQDGVIAHVDYYYGGNIVGSAPLTVDVTEDDTYDFLTDGTYEAEVIPEDESSEDIVKKLIIIAVSVVAGLAVLAVLANIFINGRSRKRRKRRTTVSRNVRRYK